MLPLASWIDPVDATFILAVLVLLAGVVLSIVAMKADDGRAQQIFAAVGVLFGLLAAGGLGGLFATQAANDAADKAAPAAAEEAAAQVSEEVSGQVEEALEAPPSGGGGSGGGKG